MLNWSINFEHGESPAASDLISIFIIVEFENIEMKDIINIDGLFNIVDNAGYQPLFTCNCGDFGCGGYYVKVLHKDDGVRIINSYDPRVNPSEESLRDNFEFEISWEDLYIISSSVYDYLIEIKEKYPHCDLCSGTFSERLVGSLDKYKNILELLRSRYEE